MRYDEDHKRLQGISVGRYQYVVIAGGLGHRHLVGVVNTFAEAIAMCDKLFLSVPAVYSRWGGQSWGPAIPITMIRKIRGL